MQSLAGASGATLGYIAGNLPGALIGYRLGRKMAPIKRYYRTPPNSRSSGSRKRIRYRKKMMPKTGSDNIVTRQYDITRQYRYKRMPRYKRRAWRKFSKKVAAVQIKQAGLRTVVFNSRSTVTSSVGAQDAFCVGLYGVAGSVDGSYGNRVHGWNDLYRIYKADPDIVQIGPAPGNVPKSGKLQFGSAVLDLTLRNLDPNIEAEVDVYYGWFKKDDDALQTKVNTNPIVKYEAAPGDTIGSTTAINWYSRGATLFDKPSGLSATGYHITRKNKLVLAPGQSTFLQHRDAKNYMVDWTNVQDCGFAKRGLTFGVWIMFKPSVTADGQAVATLGIGVTRKYSYALVEDNVDRVALNPPD